MKKFNNIIGNITSSNFIVFTDDDFPLEGLSHTKALHIQVEGIKVHDNGGFYKIIPQFNLEILKYQYIGKMI